MVPPFGIRPWVKKPEMHLSEPLHGNLPVSQDLAVKPGRLVAGHDERGEALQRVDTVGAGPGDRVVDRQVDDGLVRLGGRQIASLHGFETEAPVSSP